MQWFPLFSTYFLVVAASNCGEKRLWEDQIEADYPCVDDESLSQRLCVPYKLFTLDERAFYVDGTVWPATFRLDTFDNDLDCCRDYEEIWTILQHCIDFPPKQAHKGQLLDVDSLIGSSSAAALTLVQHLRLWSKIQSACEDAHCGSCLGKYFDYIVKRFDEYDPRNCNSIMDVVFGIIRAGNCFPKCSTALLALVRDQILSNPVYISDLLAATIDAEPESFSITSVLNERMFSWYLELADLIHWSWRQSPGLASWIDADPQAFSQTINISTLSQIVYASSAFSIPFVTLSIIASSRLQRASYTFQLPAQMQLKSLLGTFLGLAALDAVIAGCGVNSSLIDECGSAIFAGVTQAHGSSLDSFILLLIKHSWLHILEWLMAADFTNMNRYSLDAVIYGVSLMVVTDQLSLESCLQVITFFIAYDARLSSDHFIHFSFSCTASVHDCLLLILAAVSNLPLHCARPIYNVVTWEPSDQYLHLLSSAALPNNLDFLTFAMQIVLCRQRGVPITCTMQNGCVVPGSSWAAMLRTANSFLVQLHQCPDRPRTVRYFPFTSGTALRHTLSGRWALLE